jgi:hypothetical protein
MSKSKTYNADYIGFKNHTERSDENGKKVPNPDTLYPFCEWMFNPGAFNKKLVWYEKIIKRAPTIFPGGRN